MKLETQSYREQQEQWPREGRHILAQYDDDEVVVYQAYKRSIGNYAAKHGHFGGEFSYSRMSWIKPNFLWMMFRSGWGTKPGQEVVLAVHLARDFFESLLAQAVHSSFVPEVYGSHEEWKHRLAGSDVRLQWDPDHAPKGAKLARRAVQLGIRGETLWTYGHDAVLAIEDISPLVAAGRAVLDRQDLLETPAERVYVPREEAVRRHLGLDEA